MTHKIYFDLEDKVDVDSYTGEPTLEDEWEHYFFVDSQSAIQCVYSRAQSGVVVSGIILDKGATFFEDYNQIAFGEITEGVVYKFITYVFEEMKG